MAGFTDAIDERPSPLRCDLVAGLGDLDKNFVVGASNSRCGRRPVAEHVRVNRPRSACEWNVVVHLSAYPQRFSDPPSRDNAVDPPTMLSIALGNGPPLMIYVCHERCPI